MAETTTDLLAGHEINGIVLLNGATNGLLAGLALAPVRSLQKKPTDPHARGGDLTAALADVDLRGYVVRQGIRLLST